MMVSGVDRNTRERSAREWARCDENMIVEQVIDDLRNRDDPIAWALRLAFGPRAISRGFDR